MKVTQEKLRSLDEEARDSGLAEKLQAITAMGIRDELPAKEIIWMISNEHKKVQIAVDYHNMLARDAITRRRLGLNDSEILKQEHYARAFNPFG